MGKGLSLSPAEVAVIKSLHAEDFSITEISKRVKRSRKAVYNAIMTTRTDGSGKKAGPKRKLTHAAMRAVLRKASSVLYSAQKLRSMFNLPVGVRRVQQLLQKAQHLEWCKMKVAPKLAPHHREARLKWAREQITNSTSSWRKVVWSDEKKFNLDGPDGYSYYWADTRLPRRIFSKRQAGGGGLMVWGCFSYKGVGTLATVGTRVNTEVYIEILSEHLLPLINSSFPRGCLFQQDNATPHTANATKQFLSDSNIDVLPWPARSPDLNPIENLWGILARAVYADARQFDDVESLAQAIAQEWDKISDEKCKSLVHSMQKRCLAVIEKRGGETKY